MKTREQHKQELIEELLKMSGEQIADKLRQATLAINHNTKCWEAQNKNGMLVPVSQLERNNARHNLIIECCEIVNEKRGI